MTIKKNDNCSVRTIPMESLKKYYKPEEIEEHCKNCPSYGKNWSCPPHSFTVMEYIERYKTAHIIGVKVALEDFDQKEDAIDHYYECRRLVNRNLLRYEERIADSIVLLGGHCDLCDSCTREVSAECKHPQKKRYSLESLGFKVSEIIEGLFDDKLQWDRGKTPHSLYIVLGVLSNETLDLHELRKVISGE